MNIRDRNHDDDLTRRSFLKALGASVALAGLDGCTRMPGEKILPFVIQPPELTPGLAVHYATSMVLDGYATGLVVEAHEGRPTKVEGNPDHPASLGAAGVLEQASLLQLYDPDRATRVRAGRVPSTWDAFAAAMGPTALRQRVGARGAGLALLLEPASSPLIADLLSQIRSLYPDVSIHYYAPLASDANAPRTATGAAAIPQYDIRSARVILSVDSDFLAAGPFHLRYAREFADQRRDPLGGMNRLYVAEPGFSVTGTAADHRQPCRASAIEPLLASLLSIINPASEAAHGAPIGNSGGNPGVPAAWLTAVAKDLRANAGSSLVIAGERTSSRAQALATAINAALGNTGRTVWYTASSLLDAGRPAATLASLTDALRGGAVDTLLCVGGNPAYMTPAPTQFARLMRQVPNNAYVGLYENETAHEAQWFVPAAHYLEMWGDARAYDGTLSIVQPLVQPLHGGKSIVEVLAVLAGGAATGDPLVLLRDCWRRLGAAPDDQAWEAAVRRGFLAGSASARVSIATTRSVLVTPMDRSGEHVDVVFGADARVHDGTFANNGWLQELPDPVTKLTWDNGALMSPAMATRLGVDTGDAVILRRPGSALRIPALIVPGHADDTVSLHFGYGRRGAERVADGVGIDAYAFWLTAGAFLVTDAQVERAADVAHHDFAITQTHWTMEGRDQARSATVHAYRASSRAAPTPSRRALKIYDPAPDAPSQHQWAMTIDLGTCIGCSACVVACQSENNIPVVGRDNVAMSREMQWLRIDRYQLGPNENPEIVTQPMLCQHCEDAPCEYVCPVGATDHSPDGLNEMIYNRCVGTRFCSNNCPYKVRRFNWFDYNAELRETERMAKNPDVTVRERGVMEKCTFCVQRIRENEIAAELADRPLRGDEVKTACQQACPTKAIVFGSLTDSDSELMRRRGEPRAYSVLEELGTEPRVRYLARIRNSNPELDPAR